MKGFVSRYDLKAGATYEKRSNKFPIKADGVLFFRGCNWR